MVNMNRLVIAGNLTRDPELRQLSGNNAVCNFAIGVNRRSGKGDQQKEEVSFFDVECWGKTAELAGQHLYKGRPVLLEGRLKQERWEAQGGGNRSRVVIIAESVQFLGPPKDGHQGQAAEAPAQQPSPGDVNFDE